MLIKGMNLCTLRLIRTFLDFQVMVTLLIIPLQANSCQNQHDASKFRYVLCKCTHNLHSVMQSQHRHIPTNLTACNNYTSAHKLGASTLKLSATVLCVTKVSNVDFHNGQLLVNSYLLINPGSNLWNYYCSAYLTTLVHHFWNLIGLSNSLFSLPDHSQMIYLNDNQLYSCTSGCLNNV